MSKTSLGAMPPNGQATTLRTVFPPAPEVVIPASASRRMAGSTSAGRTKWSWKFWRVVMCPKPLEKRVAASAEGAQLVGRHGSLRELDPQHVDAILPLAVDASRHAVGAPGVGVDLAALEAAEILDEGGNLRLVREGRGGTGSTSMDEGWSWSSFQAHCASARGARMHGLDGVLRNERQTGDATDDDGAGQVGSARAGEAAWPRSARVPRQVADSRLEAPQHDGGGRVVAPSARTEPRC